MKDRLPNFANIMFTPFKVGQSNQDMGLHTHTHTKRKKRKSTGML